MTKVLSFTAMIFAAALVSGCDGGSAPESTAESTATTEQTDTTSTTENTEDAAKPKVSE